MHGRGAVGPRLMVRLVTIAAIIVALGVAGPHAAGAAPTTIKVAPKAIRFGTKVVGTDYFASVDDHQCERRAASVPRRGWVAG